MGHVSWIRWADAGSTRVSRVKSISARNRRHSLSRDSRRWQRSCRRWRSLWEANRRSRTPQNRLGELRARPRVDSTGLHQPTILRSREYSSEPTQSYIKFPTREAWLDGSWVRLCRTHTMGLPLPGCWSSTSPTLPATPTSLMTSCWRGDVDSATSRRSACFERNAGNPRRGDVQV